MEDISAVVGKVIEECRSKGTSVTEALVAFVARATALERSDEFRPDKAVTEAEMDKLVGLTVQKLLLKGDPKMETIKMQVIFEDTYLTQHDRVQEALKRKEESIEEAETSLSDFTTALPVDPEGM